MSIESDFVSEFIKCMADAIHTEGGFTEDVARSVEAQIRREYGGDSPYIAKTSEDQKLQTSRRNSSVICDMNNGERVPLVASRHNISRKMVYKIWDQYLEKRKIR